MLLSVPVLDYFRRAPSTSNFAGLSSTVGMVIHLQAIVIPNLPQKPMRPKYTICLMCLKPRPLLNGFDGRRRGRRLARISTINADLS
jgi:hypothetical protein